jgi:hypothetical protein
VKTGIQLIDFVCGWAAGLQGETSKQNVLRVSDQN